MEHYDVLIVGAGISGIGAAYHIKTRCPGRTFAIFEAREAMGGTWDLFRYPGVRSDSDMFTLGFAFRPWTEAKAIADGPSILKYLGETARAYDLEKHIQFGRKVSEASWDSATSRWTVTYRRGEGAPEQVTCNFLHMCAGYYNYAAGYRPEFAGEETFKGQFVHPQFWPNDLDYRNKRVVVIGSGATAVTLVPEMARDAAHVVMLQRSPTYVVSRPAEDPFANKLRRRLPAKLAYAIIRWRNVLMQMWFFNMTRKEPAKVKAAILDMVRAELGPDYDIDTHFTPRYNPWDQRLCLVPDADLFAAIRNGSAEVVTDTIERFTETVIRLKSGQELPADVVVTATGLELQLVGGLKVTVDGTRVELPKCFSYKGMMYSGVPNLASSFGYTNASWTLKADLTAGYLCRLLNHMKKKGLTEARPIIADPNMAAEPWLSFSSGYIQRALDRLPKQGRDVPWRVHQNYALDMFEFRFCKLADGAMQFSRPHVVAAPQPAAESAREPELAEA
jgi:cation diffusion facilitator CzcD-associated flavoprotein CzcO